MKKEKSNLDRARIEKNPDYYAVESDGEVVAMVTEILEETVFGQPAACVEVAKPIARFICGLDDPSRPIYVGLFLGESGVGKTEMGVAVSKVFDPQYPEERLKIIDCNMFQQSHDVQRILGAPPSYVGYGDEPLIGKEFLAQPNVLVFDEVEKADTALHRLLLRIMDKARLDINESEEDRMMYVEEEGELPGLDFSNSVIILTSNLGSDEIKNIRSGNRSMGFVKDNMEAQQRDIHAAGIAAADRFWHHMPEFLNRIDSTVVFNSLTTEVVHKIFDKFLNEFTKNYEADATQIMATNQLREWIIAQTDICKAGRELKRKINDLIITPAAGVKFKIPKGVPLIADISRDEPKRVIFWLSKTMVNSASRAK
ncbi:TPA: hypothetical protein DIU27_00390 [Candidatus Collierbacteria bacterium]|nr:MAG: ATPase AAA-2 domain protein [Candidatus Collierbacteria bacterium GW2011_GWA2_44_13]KKT63032.1 MAG: ATPase AAA-2 domain protein [Candidatus Collierbacteria bacterium GW2011_GWD1_44_27]KKT68583.1 MAG: ATPase AAA-2 domain protein [Microgenomates group bacterium GW2011_GWC1_44_37]KKT89524.1 MAG: ATPase AAA-2 domain protein [Candidatus Collierbacteria bacterium GW2011_GWD2_45_10]HCQ30829.1 hypothetical protein [Candidatus Collierbacteria bacterium]